jgi:hypothetical protein
VVSRTSQVKDYKIGICCFSAKYAALRSKLQDLQRQLHECKLNRDKDSSEVLSLQDQLGNKVTELYELHEQIISVIRKESNS